MIIAVIAEFYAFVLGVAAVTKLWGPHASAQQAFRLGIFPFLCGLGCSLLVLAEPFSELWMLFVALLPAVLGAAAFFGAFWKMRAH